MGKSTSSPKPTTQNRGGGGTDDETKTRNYGLSEGSEKKEDG